MADREGGLLGVERSLWKTPSRGDMLIGMAIRTGSKVKWKWGNSWAEGKVAEVHHGDVTRTTKGEQITRHGTDDNPAYVIEQEDGTVVLKLSSEVERDDG